MKNKIINLLKPRILLVGISLLLWNCESENVDSPEEEQSNIETVAINEVVDFFNAKTFSDSSKPDSETYVIPYLTHIAQEEINNSDALLTIIPATTIHSAHYSRILLLKINNEIQSLVFSMYASDGSTHEQFSGEIIITYLNGNFLNGYRVVNGVFIAQFRKTGMAGKTPVAAKNNNVVCPDHGECTEDSTCVLCLQELEEVVVTGNSGNNGGPAPFVDLNDFPGIEEGGGGGPDMGMGWDYGPGEGGSPDDNNAEEDITIDPDFSNDYPCQAAIVQEAYGVCSPLTQLILDLFETNDGTNLVYKSVDDIEMQSNGSPVNARTTQIFTYNVNTHTCNVTVKIRESYLETATDLSIARTVLHESLHANLVYMLEEGLLTLSDGTVNPDFADLVNAHLDYISGLPVNLNKAHHELMASFVGDIATSLAAFGSQNGYDLPFSYYEALSWQGLHTTADFDILYPEYIDGELNPERITIINSMASEQDNQNYPDGNGGTISPQGTPCD